MTNWKDIAGYKGRYQVSDDGQVRSMPNATRKGVRILKPGIDHDGYRSVALYDGRRNSHRRKVHLLLLEAFVGDRPSGLLGCHKDDDKANNTLANLRWDTRGSNIADAIRNGVLPIGEKNGGGGKLRDADVVTIKAKLRLGHSQSELAREYRVSPQLVHKIDRGKLWRHIS